MLGSNVRLTVASFCFIALCLIVCQGAFPQSAQAMTVEPGDYKIVYKNCYLALNPSGTETALGIAANPSGALSLSFTDTSDKSTVKILALRKGVPAKVPLVDGIYNDVKENGGGIAWLQSQSITGVTISGDMKIFLTKASLPALSAAGKIKKVTALRANIGMIAADSLGKVKILADPNDGSEQTTSIETIPESAAGGLVGNIALIGTALDGLSMPGKALNKLSVASKKGPGVVGLSGIKGDIEADQISKMTAKGCAITPDTLIILKNASPMKISAKSGVFKGATPSSALGCVSPVVADITATKLLVTSSGGNIKPDILVVDGELTKIMAKAKKIDGELVGGVVGLEASDLTTETMARRDANIEAYLTSPTIAAMGVESSVFVSETLNIKTVKAVSVFGSFIPGASVDGDGLLTPDLSETLVKVIASKTGEILGEYWSAVTAKMKGGGATPVLTQHDTIPE